MNARPVRYQFALLLLYVAVLVISGVPYPSYAVIPPDLVFTLGSQIAQMYAIGGAIMLSMMMAVIPNISAFFQSALVRHLLLFFGAIAILAIWSYALLAIYRPDVQRPWAPVDASITAGTTTGAVAYEIGNRFYSDRFVFVGRRADGSSIALDIYANRMELAEGGFIHYYMSESVDGKKSARAYREQLSPGSGIVPDLVFDAFSREPAADHSSRETYAFSLKAGGVEYALQTSELKSDFITKNEPDNTEYMSVGTAILRSKDETIRGDVLFQRIYSSDYRASIFFDGYSRIKSEATQIILWDEAGSFYMADVSDVHDQSPFYSSHFWALSKNADGRAQKSFSGTIERENEPPDTFRAAIPDLGISLIVVGFRTLFQQEKAKGYVEGTISDGMGEHAVSGIVSYHEYGNR